MAQDKAIIVISLCWVKLKEPNMQAFHGSAPPGFKRRLCHYLLPNDAFCTSLLAISIHYALLPFHNKLRWTMTEGLGRGVNHQTKQTKRQISILCIVTARWEVTSEEIQWRAVAAGVKLLRGGGRNLRVSSKSHYLRHIQLANSGYHGSRGRSPGCKLARHHLSAVEWVNLVGPDQASLFPFIFIFQFFLWRNNLFVFRTFTCTHRLAQLSVAKDDWQWDRGRGGCEHEWHARELSNLIRAKNHLTAKSSRASITYH